MKKSILILLCILGWKANAQQIRVNEHVIHWALGFSYHHGVQYNFEIKIPKGEWQAFDSVYVCTPDGSTGFARNKLGVYEKNDTIIFNVPYSKTYDMSKPEYMPGEKHKTEECAATSVSLFKAYARKQVEVTVRTETILAYP